MTLEEEIFKKRELNTKKLLEYGFIKKDDYLEYQKLILNNNFEIVIKVKGNKITGKIIDKEFDDEYLNYRVENQIGEFANTIRDEFIHVLEEIKEKCTIKKSFVNNQSNRITDLILKKYLDSPEFIFNEDTTGVFRNKNNKKWYGIIMNVDYKKFYKKDGKVDIMNIKLNPSKIDNLINEEGFFRAFHMNKKTWISIILDDTVKDEKIMELIDESYNYTVDTKEWVLPANPNYFDIFGYMRNRKTVEWKQPKNINVGDNVYIYIGSPVSAIIYKTEVLEKDIENNYSSNKTMILKILKEYDRDKYTFKKVKEYDLRAVRGPRKMPKKLIDKIKNDEEHEEEIKLKQTIRLETN